MIGAGAIYYAGDNNAEAVSRGKMLGEAVYAVDNTTRHCEPGTKPGHAGASNDEQTIVDVRGKAADEALDDVVAALDRATVAGAPFLRIIHGHGTGKLKASLRDYLKDSPYVTEFRAGDRAEGGDGVTIATLR